MHIECGMKVCCHCNINSYTKLVFKDFFFVCVIFSFYPLYFYFYFFKNDCIDNGIKNISLQHIISREGIGD